MHVDKPQTHIVSFILHIDSSDDAEPWPIFIEDYRGNTHEVTLTPGDLLFYESAKCWHGRPRRLNGSWYSSVFSHYRKFVRMRTAAYDFNPMVTTLLCTPLLLTYPFRSQKWLVCVERWTFQQRTTSSLSLNLSLIQVWDQLGHGEPLCGAFVLGVRDRFLLINWFSCLRFWLCTVSLCCVAAPMFASTVQSKSRRLLSLESSRTQRQPIFSTFDAVPFGNPDRGLSKWLVPACGNLVVSMIGAAQRRLSNGATVQDRKVLWLIPTANGNFFIQRPSIICVHNWVGASVLPLHCSSYTIIESIVVNDHNSEFDHKDDSNSKGRKRLLLYRTANVAKQVSCQLP